MCSQTVPQCHTSCKPPNCEKSHFNCDVHIKPHRRNRTETRRNRTADKSPRVVSDDVIVHLVNIDAYASTTHAAFALAHPIGELARRLQRGELPQCAACGERLFRGNGAIDARSLAVQHRDCREAMPEWEIETFESCWPWEPPVEIWRRPWAHVYSGYTQAMEAARAAGGVQ
jgi:hypothetical protein